MQNLCVRTLNVYVLTLNKPMQNYLRAALQTISQLNLCVLPVNKFVCPHAQETHANSCVLTLTLRVLTLSKSVCPHAKQTHAQFVCPHAKIVCAHAKRLCVLMLNVCVLMLNVCVLFVWPHAE